MRPITSLRSLSVRYQCALRGRSIFVRSLSSTSSLVLLKQCRTRSRVGPSATVACFVHTSVARSQTAVIDGESADARSLQRIGVDIGNFRELRQRGYVYVDKTELLAYLVELGGSKFILRPRKFGKSLMLSTIAEMFGPCGDAKTKLFDGLWVAKHKPELLKEEHPVILLDFGSLRKDCLADSLMTMLREVGVRFGVEFGSNYYIGDMVRLLFATVPQAVVLIDEYDKPIVNVLEANGGKANELARTNLEVMKTFLEALKGCSLRFSMVTGVSKFSLSGLFSGANQFDDISFDEVYSALLGYTRIEVANTFAPYVEALRVVEGLPDAAAVYDKLFAMYNGYRFSNTYSIVSVAASVSNPFSVGMAFQKKLFGDFWIQQGASGWLPKVLSERPVINLDWQKRDFLLKFSLKPDGAHDVDATALLLQTGYLTVKECDREKGMRLDFANAEVKRGFESIIMPLLETSFPVRAESAPVFRKSLDEIERAFVAGDVMRIVRIFDEHMRFTTWESFMLQHERLFHKVFHDMLYFATYGAVTSERSVARGKIDVEVVHKGRYCIFELKYVRKTATRNEISDALAEAVVQVRDYLRRTPMRTYYKVCNAGVLVVRDRLNADEVKATRANDAQQRAVAVDAVASGDKNGFDERVFCGSDPNSLVVAAARVSLGKVDSPAEAVLQPFFVDVLQP